MVKNFKSCILNACTTCPLILFFLLRFFVFTVLFPGSVQKATTEFLKFRW